MPSLIFDPQTNQQLDLLAHELPQSLLLTGEPGVGLLTAAQFLASKNLASTIRPTDKDGNEIATGSIRLDAIRQLRQQTRGRITKQTVHIIDDADRMNHQAQNAFLKLLEEPTPHRHFILTSHQPHLLLPTILSRTVREHIKPVSTQQSQLLIKRLGVTDPRTRQQLSFLADGRPAELVRLASDQRRLETAATVIRDAEQLIRGTTYERAAIALRYTNRTEALTLLDHALTILKHSIRNKPSIATIARTQAVATAYERIAANGNVRLQLVALAL